jgi:hypothetical protein
MEPPHDIEPSASGRAELIDQLFVETLPPFVDAYGSEEDRLDAVASRRKAMEMHVWPASAVTDGDEDYIAIVEQATARGLSVLHLPAAGSSDVPHVRVYVLPPENTWRALAHRALWEVYAKDGVWSHEAEELEGFLLGYTDDERRRWRQHNERTRLGWRGQTIHLLMERRSAERVAALANRCLDPAIGDHEVLAAYASRGHVPCDEALSLLGTNFVLARAAVRSSLVDELFGHPTTWAPDRTPHRSLTKRLIAATNQALVSALELLTPEGWR